MKPVGLFLRRAHHSSFPAACPPGLRAKPQQILSYSSSVSDSLHQIAGLNIFNMGLCSTDSSFLVREEDEKKTA